MHHPPHSPLFGHANNIWSVIQMQCVGQNVGVFNVSKWHIYSPLYLGASRSSTIHSNNDILMVDGHRRERKVQEVSQ